MQLTLFQLPLPSAPLPLGVLALLMAAVTGTVAALAWRHGHRELLAIAAAIAVGGVIAGLWLDDAVYVPHALDVTLLGALLVVSILASWTLTAALARGEGVPERRIEAAFLATVVAGVLGARLLFAVGHLDGHAATSWLDVRGGGLTAYGAVIGGSAVALLAFDSWRERGVWLDAAVPSFALGESVCRFGSHLEGESPGRVLPAWAPDWLSVVAEGRHPAQLYLALGCATLFFATWQLRRRTAARGGTYLAFLALYGGLRFAVDAVRADPWRWQLGPHVQAHWAVPCGLAMLGCAFIYGASDAVSRRTVAWALALLPAAAAALAFRTDSEPLQFTVSQWLAMAGGVAAMVVWPVAIKSGASGQQSEATS